MRLGYVFLPTINTGFGYDFEPISLIRVHDILPNSKIPSFRVPYEKFVKILV